MTAPVRLAVVVPDLHVGGLQEMAVRLATSLDGCEFEPRFYTFDDGGPLADDLAEHGIAHVHAPRAPGVAPGHARVLAAHFAADGIGLVHCHNVTALFHGARAGRRAGNLPVLFTEHDREMPAPWKHRVLHRWLSRRTTRIVVVSDRLRGDLIRYEGFPPDRTATLHNGVPDPRDAWSGSRQLARAELDWDDAPVALAVGSLTAVKNHAGMIDMFARMRNRVPTARLVIAGIGPLDADLRAAAGGLPEGAVTLLGERRDVPRLLAACDLFVLPSHREGLSLSLIEAHGVGRPSLVFDVGGNAEVVVHGETGWLAPEADAAAFTERMASALGDRSALQSLGETARRRFLEAFTHEKMVCAYVDLYRALCGREIG